MARRITATPTKRSKAPERAISLTEATILTIARWQSSATHTDQTLDRMSATIHRFTRRLAAAGINDVGAVTPRAVREFVNARTADGHHPQIATRHSRRTAIRTFYRTLRALGLHEGDPTLDVPLPARTRTSARPLSDDEVVLCRASAQIGPGGRSSLRAVAWALGEATAISSEITTIRLSDLDDLYAPTAVELPGTRRHDPRLGELTTWGRRIVADRAAQLLSIEAPTSALLAYGGGAPPGGAKAQASVCNALRDVLDAAGLRGEPDVRPASLRNWAGRRAYNAGLPVEGVAVMLGCRSLDTAAEDIGLDWRGVSA